MQNSSRHQKKPHHNKQNCGAGGRVIKITSATRMTRYLKRHHTLWARSRHSKCYGHRCHCTWTRLFAWSWLKVRDTRAVLSSVMQIWCRKTRHAPPLTLILQNNRNGEFSKMFNANYSRTLVQTDSILVITWARCKACMQTKHQSSDTDNTWLQSSDTIM